MKREDHVLMETPSIFLSVILVGNRCPWPAPPGGGNTHLSKVAARMYLPFGENFTKDTGGLSSSARRTQGQADARATGRCPADDGNGPVTTQDRPSGDTATSAHTTTQNGPLRTRTPPLTRPCAGHIGPFSSMLLGSLTGAQQPTCHQGSRSKGPEANQTQAPSLPPTRGR